MANKINFETGETYTLSEIFSGERRIIIPDLQRDYCWGDEDNTKSTGVTGELVSDFVTNLIEQYNQKSDTRTLNLGLLYGYEVPANHIQLCDGQQRLTTLYLLLGMINKVIGTYRSYLISDFEYNNDDKEPYLNYSIRETSLYFLSDLVCKFFLDRRKKVETIKSADWYFSDYDLDPSIQSMLNALYKMEILLDGKDEEWMSHFGDWLLNKLTFLYVDMQNRKNGEETFVVINTTGESLSATQNLKPLVINEKNNQFNNTSFHTLINKNNVNIAECWEIIETWFWSRRRGDNDTADAGFAEFFRWISIIEQVNVVLPKQKINNGVRFLNQLILQGKGNCEFPYKTIAFKVAYKYWIALKWIANNPKFKFVDNYLSPGVNNDVNGRNAIGQDDCFVLLPLLKFVYLNVNTIQTNTLQQRNARRIYEFFNNLIRISNVSKAVNSLVGETIRVIDIIQKNGGDIISLLSNHQNVSASIYTKEEERKFQILSKAPNRNDIEDAFWSAQKHSIWSGEILPMIEWATDKKGNFNLNKFLQYQIKFEEVFPNGGLDNIDSVRRALIAFKLREYPRIFKGYTNYSFGWECSDWQTLINENKDQFKIFFDKLISGISISQLERYSLTSDSFKAFAEIPELLAYSEKKNIQRWNDTYRIIKSSNASSFIELHTFCLYIAYKNITTFDDTVTLDGIDYQGWKMWIYDKGLSALVFDRTLDRISNNVGVAIDVHYYGNSHWDLQLFVRDEKIDAKTTLKKIAKFFGLIWNGDRYEVKDLSKELLITKLNYLLGHIGDVR